MEAIQYIWSTISGFGVLLGIFLSISLWRLHNPSVFSNRVFASLLTALSVRELQLILSLYAKVPTGFESIAIASMLVTPPLFWMLMKSLLLGRAKMTGRDIMLFFLVIMVVIAVYYISIGDWGYISILFHFLPYLFVSTWLWWRHRVQQTESTHLRWVMLLLVSFWGIWLSYLVGFFYGDGALEICYSATFSYAVMMYSAAGCVFTKSFVFSEKPPLKYKNSTFGQLDKHALFRQLAETVVAKQLYLQTGLTVDIVSSETGFGSRQISQLVNEMTGTNFSDWINSFRIAEAKRLLSDPRYRVFKIAAIGFESGFNTLSSFNATFKIKTGVTPSEFRNAHQPGGIGEHGLVQNGKSNRPQFK